MMSIDDLDRLIRALGELGDLQTVCSPSRPCPPELTREIEQFLRRYRFLEQDLGYAAFLRRYAGAALISPDSALTLDLFGFSDSITLHFTKGEGEPVENGFLTFSDLVIPLDPGGTDAERSIGCGFGFPATADKRWGVYRISEGSARWYCETFLGWLERYVATAGQLLD